MSGRKGAVKPGRRPAGTTVEVRDLFVATPARLKFLKSDRAEAQAVADVVRRLAMAHPGVRFALARRRIRQASICRPAPTDAEGRLARVGQRLSARISLPTHCRSRPSATVSRLAGFAGLPTFHRANARQPIPLRQRPAGARQAARRRRSGRPTRTTCRATATPCWRCSSRCDPRDVDVNVHPAKADVRFRDPGLVRGLIVRRHPRGPRGRAAPRRDDGRRARMRRRSGAHRRTPCAGTAAGAGALGRRRAVARRARRMAPRHRGRDSPRRGQAAFAGTSRSGAADGARPRRRRSTPPHAEAPLGAARAQLHETYIVAQTGDGIVIVDQHAAHERLVYERMKAAPRAARGSPARCCSFPLSSICPAEAAARLLDHAEDLAGLGLDVEAFGPGAVAVREVPALLGGGDVAAPGARPRRRARRPTTGAVPLERTLDHVLATMACHHSVRAGRRLRPTR